MREEAGKAESRLGLEGKRDLVIESGGRIQIAGLLRCSPGIVKVSPRVSTVRRLAKSLAALAIHPNLENFSISVTYSQPRSDMMDSVDQKRS